LKSHLTHKNSIQSSLNSRKISVENRNTISTLKLDKLLDGKDLIREKALANKEWLNLVKNTPASERNKFNRGASFMLARDASSILSDHTSLKRPYFKRPGQESKLS